MKILLRLFSKKFGYADERWDALSREERYEITLLFQRLLMHAEAHSIVIWHAGKNHAFKDSVEDWINFAKMSINWGGYGSRIRIQSVYDYFKYEYEGDAAYGRQLKSAVTANKNTFRGVTAFFEEGVSREAVDKFKSLDGTVSRKGTGKLCLKVVKGDEPVIEKGYMGEEGFPFFIVSEASLKELFPNASVKRKGKEREAKAKSILGAYSEAQRQESIGSDRKQVGRLRKLLFSTDKDHIDTGISLLASFSDPFLYDSLLQGVSMNRSSNTCILVPTAGTAKETPFFNYAATAILYHAGPDCLYAAELKKDVLRLAINTVSVSYLACFPTLEHLILSDTSGRISDLDDLDPALPIKSFHLLDCVGLRDISKLQRFPVTTFQFSRCPELASLAALKDKRDEGQVKAVWLEHMDKLETLDGIEFYQGMEVLKMGELKGLKDASALKKCPIFNYIDYRSYKLNLPSCQSMDGLIGPQCKKLQIRLAGWGAPTFPAAADLEELDIECQGMQDLEWLASFPRLKNLTIVCKSLGNTRGLRFTPLLESLSFNHAEFSHLQLPESLDRLRSIQLSYCNQLRGLEEVKPLTAIEEVTISSCTSLESIQGITDNARLRGEGSLDVQDLPSLKVLGSPGFLDSLRHVKITGAFHAGLLEHLAAASNLEDIHFNSSNDRKLTLKTDEEWKAAFFISDYDMEALQAPGVRRLALTYCWIHDFSKNTNLSGVRELSLKKCGQLESLAGLEHSKGIEHLSIRHCEKLEDIDSLQQLSQLKYLALDGLDSLKRISSIAYLANLTTLAIDHCPVLEVSPRRKVQSDREDILKFRLSLSEHYQTGLQEALTRQLDEAKKSRSATVPDKEARLIRKGLRERDIQSIRKAVSRLEALQDATLLDALLDGITHHDKEIVPSPFFKGTAPAQIYLNTAMMGVLGVAARLIPRWKEFTEGVTILDIHLWSIEYVGCFRNLVSLEINRLEVFPSPVDLPKLEYLKIYCYSTSGTVRPEERMRLEYLSPCRNLKSITIKGVLDSLDTLDFMQEFKVLEMLSIRDTHTCILRDLTGLGQCTRLKNLELALYWVWGEEASRASVPGELRLDGIEGCTALETLSLCDIPLMDTKGIRGLKNIREIELERLPIHQLTMPEEAPVLERISIEYCRNLSSVSPGTSSENLSFQCVGTSLEELPIPRTAANLTACNIYGNPQLASLDAFRHVKAVEDNKITLEEDARQIKDINGVSHIPNLILELDVPMLPQNIVPNLIIGLRLSGIRSLEGIGQFPKLTRLAIAKASEGFSLEALQELKSLQVLELEDNEHLLSLKGIAHLGHLQVLNLKNTPNLADISDLEKMTVDSIYTRGSKMKKADFPGHLQHKVIWN